MQKIGCGSAIKVNFIALALHYLCRKNKLKPFGKMIVFIFVALLFLFVGEIWLSLIFFGIIIIAYLTKPGDNENTDDCSGNGAWN